MTLYFEKTIKNPSRGAINVFLEWHKTSSLLAVSGFNEDDGGIVSIYNEEGEILESSNIPSNVAAQVTAIAWHPHKQILAIGWENGEVHLYDASEGQLQNTQPMHEYPICQLKWSNNGSRLISADMNGTLQGWKTGSKNFVMPLFQHELKVPITQLVFRTLPETKQSVDISGLARAAVSGDEKALDLFSSWRPKTGHQRLTFNIEPKEHLGFFVGSVAGLIYYINEEGVCSEVLHTEGAISRLLFHESRDVLVVVTDGFVLGQFFVDTEGHLQEITKVKLNGKSSEIHIIWAGRGLLAVSSGESVIRLWDIDLEDNYVLSLEGSPFQENIEVITSLAFCANKGILTGGTNLGNIGFWKFKGEKGGENNWLRCTPSSLSGAIKELKWGSTKNLLSVNVVKEVFILNEHQRVAVYNDEMSVVQVSPSQLSIDSFGIPGHLELKSDIQIEGVYVSGNHIAVWNRKKMVTYSVSTETGHLKVVGSFDVECEAAGIYEQSLYLIEDGKVQVRTFQGTVKQTLSFLESEGEPLYLNIGGHFLTAATMFGVLKIWDLSRREARPHVHPKVLSDVIKDFGEVISCKINCNGTKVGLITAQSSLLPDPKLYVWDLEADMFMYFNFASGRTEDEDNIPPPNTANDSNTMDVVEKNRHQWANEVSGRFVLSLHWDQEEAKLLVVEAKLLPKNPIKYIELGEQSAKTEVVIVTMFATADEGVFIQDTFPLTPAHARLIGAHVPHVYLLRSAVSTDKSLVDQRTMRDFVGLEGKDKAVRDAMVSFSYFISIGNMDEAFKSIKTIKSETVWENMTRMCVKNKRLDVASVCLGKMGHARGAKALREAALEPELDARVGILAVHLGMQEEAEKLFKTCSRYDLLNKLYQGGNNWAKAIEVAENNDRIHMRSTYYNYAKYLESRGEYLGAIPYYEKSDTHKFEVPRMLFDDLATLEDYVRNSEDKRLYKWWAQFMESQSEMDEALQFYNMAGDHLSIVRVYCYLNELDKAAELAALTRDKSACYHLARQYESLDMIPEAIEFFRKAHAYGNAIRICKENGLDDKIFTLAYLAGPLEQLDAARYYEQSERPLLDKAVKLYHKAGYLSKAVELAFRSEQHSVIQAIAVELNGDSDPNVVDKCAQFFIKNNQADKAVDVYARSKKYLEALELCLKHNITLTEELADQLTIPKGSGVEQDRVNVLEKVAECAYQQENYHLATKKFTQSGNKVKAMKSLLKSGDTEKIIFFANVSRQREIYVMAANFLQTLNWRKDPKIMNHIINFYTKGRALELLAGFYVACAQVEIDEYKNYEKALNALNEAMKSIHKSKDPGLVESRAKTIQIQRDYVKTFVEMKQVYESNPDEALETCRTLLQEPNVESGVRRGDIYAFLVDHYITLKNYSGAYDVISEMKSSLPDTSLTYYIEPDVLEEISVALNIPLARRDSGRKQPPSRPLSDDDEEVGYEDEDDDGDEADEELIYTNQDAFISGLNGI